MKQSHFLSYHTSLVCYPYKEWYYIQTYSIQHYESLVLLVLFCFIEFYIIVQFTHCQHVHKLGKLVFVLSEKMTPSVIIFAPTLSLVLFALCE